MGAIRTEGRVDERLAALAPIGALLGVLTVYVATLAPSVTTEDAGELVAAAALFGVPHPPGFPLYCLLVHGVIASGLGSPAYAANLASALFGLWTLAALYAALRSWRVTRAPALLAVLVFGLGRTFWSQAIIAEVYTLNTALLATSVALLARGERAPDEARWLPAAVAAAGLGLANHHPLTLLAAPGLAAYAIATQRHHLARASTWLGCGLALLPGIALYAYLPWAARAAPPVNWGDPSTVARLWDHVRRRAYHDLERSAAVTWDDKAAFFRDFLQLAGQELAGPLPWLALVAVVCGFWALRRASARWFVVGVLAFNPIALLLLLRFPYEPEHVLRVNEYYLPAYLALAIAVAFALDALRRALPGRGGPAALALTAAAMVALVADRWPRVSRAGDHLAEDFSRAVLESLEPDAIYFPSGDYATFPALYLQSVEGVRQDVLLANYTGEPSADLIALARRLDPSVDVTSPGALQLTLLRRTQRPLYFASKSDVRVFGLRLDPWGLVYRARRRGEPPPASAPDVDVDALLRNAGQADYQPEDLGRSALADAHRMAGEHALGRGDRERALEHFERAEGLLTDSKEGLNNLGSTLAEHGFPERAIALYRAAADLSARYATPRRNLAQLYERQGDPARALEAYEDLLRVTPDDQDARARREALSAEAEREATHLEQMQATVEAQPDNAASWNNLGSALAQAGRPQRARDAFERALALDPGYALPHRNLALLYETALPDPAAAARHRDAYERLK